MSRAVLVVLLTLLSVRSARADAPLADLTAAVIAVLVMLSVILTASVLFPGITEGQIIGVLVGGSMLTVAMAVVVKVYERWRGKPVAQSLRVEQGPRESWRMPPLASLAPARITLLNRLWMLVLRGYLLIAAGLLLAKLVQLALSAT